MAHHHDTKQVLNRLSRAIGHLEAAKKMVEEGQDCIQVLIQLAEVRSQQYRKNHSERPYQSLHCGGCGNRGQKSAGGFVGSHRPVHEMRGFL